MAETATTPVTVISSYENQFAPETMALSETATPTPTLASDSRCEKPPEIGLYCIYTVQSGDTLASIAVEFGIHGSAAFTPGDLIAANNRPYITDTNSVFTGQKLRIPVANGALHVVLEGETIETIASSYGVTADSIAGFSLNDLGQGTPELFQEVLVPDPKVLAAIVPPGPPASNLAAEATATPPPAEETATPEPSETAEPSPTPTVSPTATPTPKASQTPKPNKTPTKTPAPKSGTPTKTLYTKAELLPFLAKYSWPIDQALSVIFGPTPPNANVPGGCPLGESSGNTTAVGSAGERGLFQIGVVHIWRFQKRGWSWNDAFVPEKNIAIAFEIYSEAGGWWPWTCRP